MILKLRFDWATRVDGNGQAVCDESLFDTFFASGADTSRMLKTLLSYMELFDHSWHILVISFLTHLSNLSGLLPGKYIAQFSSFSLRSTNLFMSVWCRFAQSGLAVPLRWLAIWAASSWRHCGSDALACWRRRIRPSPPASLISSVRRSATSRDLPSISSVSSPNKPTSPKTRTLPRCACSRPSAHAIPYRVWNPMKRLLQDCNEPIALEMVRTSSACALVHSMTKQRLCMCSFCECW